VAAAASTVCCGSSLALMLQLYLAGSPPLLHWFLLSCTGFLEHACCLRGGIIVNSCLLLQLGFGLLELLQLLVAFAIPHSAEVVLKLEAAPRVNIAVQRGLGSVLHPALHVLRGRQFRAVEPVVLLQPRERSHPANLMFRVIDKPSSPSANLPAPLDACRCEMNSDEWSISLRLVPCC